MTPDVITDCRTRPVALKAVRYGGSSPDAVQSLLWDLPDVTAFTDDDGQLVLRRHGRADCIVVPGWYVTRSPGDVVTVHAAPAFAEFIEEAL